MFCIFGKDTLISKCLSIVMSTSNLLASGTKCRGSEGGVGTLMS